MSSICAYCNGPDYLCTCKRDQVTGGGAFGEASSYGRSPGGNNYTSSLGSYDSAYSRLSSRATNYSDVFDRNSTASSASSFDNIHRCGRCGRARHECNCLRNQYVPNRMSTSRPNRNSPTAPSVLRGNTSTMCYRCRRPRSSCSCISGTLYNPGGYSNQRTAYQNSPVFDDEPSWMQSNSDSRVCYCGRMMYGNRCHACGRSR